MQKHSCDGNSKSPSVCIRRGHLDSEKIEAAKADHFKAFVELMTHYIQLPEPSHQKVVSQYLRNLQKLLQSSNAATLGGGIEINGFIFELMQQVHTAGEVISQKDSIVEYMIRLLRIQAGIRQTIRGEPLKALAPQDAQKEFWEIYKRAQPQALSGKQSASELTPH